MRRISIIALACAALPLLAGGCPLTQPTTEIGMIGYKNIGFEKSIEFTGRMVDVNADNVPETLIIESAKVTNDATKTFEAQLENQRLLYEFWGGRIDQLIGLADTLLQHYLTQQAAPPAETAANDPPWWYADLIRRLPPPPGE